MTQSSLDKSNKRKIKIPERFAGTRVDSVLSEILEDISRARIIKLIKNGDIQINGLSVKPSRTITGGETIILNIPEINEPGHPVPENISLDIIYEDDDMVIVNKPAGMIVHPGSGVSSSTLVNAIVFHYSEISSVGERNRPGIVHRLDKETSGVMVIARNELSYEKLVDQFKSRKVKKEYIAIICGGPSRESGEFYSYLGRHTNNRIKISSNTTSGKEARTEWIVVSRYGELTLIKAFPRTGRTHQIRVHFSEAGLPLLGDRLYGGKKNSGLADEMKLKRHALHASRISFIHPRTGNLVEYYAPIPDDLAGVIKILNEKRIESENL